MKGNVLIYIFTAFIVSYIIRVLPLTIIKKPIKNRFIKSFLYYVPYVTLAVMTFPDIINSTNSIWSGIIALAVSLCAAWFGLGLFPVACISCGTVFLAELVIEHLPL